MAAETNVLSQSISALDTSSGGSGGVPYQPAPGIVSAGRGAKAYLWEVDDYASVGASAITFAGSYYRLLRIPTNAVVKSLVVGMTRLDSNGANTLAFDLGIAFSDSLYDGTRPEQQALIPTTANDGATTTTFAAYSAPNKLFGALSAATIGNAATGYLSGNLLFNGVTANYPFNSLVNMPLWQLFGFVDGRGYAMNPGGMFDIYAYATTGAATGVAGSLWAKCDFVL